MNKAEFERYGKLDARRQHQGGRAVSLTRPVRVAVLLGDAGGVGPEMAVRLLADPTARASAAVLLIADPVVLAAGRAPGRRGAAAGAAASGPTRRCASPGADQLVAPRHAGRHRAAAAARPPRHPAAARCSALELACQAVQQGAADAIVFAPFNKHALRLGGLAQEDELRWLQHRLGVRDFVCEFNITGSLWTSRVTSHVPLRDVAALITPRRRSATRCASSTPRCAGRRGAPRIAVSGLNPHAGDGGSIGREEIEIIAPACSALQPTAWTRAAPSRPTPCSSPRAAATSTPWCRCTTTRARSR
jgi:4-hydroxythreonine-4-phosphate dehydrogenase